MNRNSHPFSPKSFAIPFHQNHSLFQESLMMGNSTPQVHMHYQKKQQSPLTTTSFVSTIILNRAINQ
jgi:hypothetical protein